MDNVFVLLVDIYIYVIIVNNCHLKRKNTHSIRHVYVRIYGGFKQYIIKNESISI